MGKRFNESLIKNRGKDRLHTQHASTATTGYALHFVLNGIAALEEAEQHFLAAQPILDA